MTVLWTTEELPGARFDPEPDDEDDSTWSYHPDLWGQHATVDQLITMTTINPTGGYL